MRRGSLPIAVLALAPLLFGFEPLRSRNGEIEQGNALMKSGNAEECAWATTTRPSPRRPRRAGRALRSRRGALRAPALRRGRPGVPCAPPRYKDGALKAQAFYNLGNAFFKKEKFKGGRRGVQSARRWPSTRADERAKWNLEVALRKQRKSKKDKDKDKDKDKKDDQKKDD